MTDLPAFHPQPGPQTAFLQSDADIAIMGGAAGGGKTYGLLLEPLRFFHLEGVNAVIFRREGQQLNLPGSIWLESQKIYVDLGCTPNKTLYQYQFSRNSYLKFSGLQYEQDVYSFQGAQLDFLGLDELTHFTEFQFWYLIGRLRSVSGQVKPYCRATCNPDQGWVFDLIKWWIDEKTGYPIAERSGKKRWMYKLDSRMVWFDDRETAVKSLAAQGIDDRIEPLSITFIPATLNDNQELLANDPTYYSKLAQLPESERQQMLEGRWFFRPQGKLFKPDWFARFVVEPRERDVVLITSDTASSTKTANDYTCFQVWTRAQGKMYLLKEVHGQFSATQQLTLLRSLILESNAKYVSIERAATGFYLIQEIVKSTGVIVLEMTRQKDKYARGHDVQAYVEQGYVLLNPNAEYYTGFISEVAAFSPENKTKAAVHDDRVDCLIDAIYHLLIKRIDMRQERTRLPDTSMTSQRATGL